MAANLFATDNEFDIPSLRLEWQATRILAPVIGWGTLGRSLAMPGTYHFYVQDRHFNALVDAPEKLLVSGCSAAGEPNISVLSHTSRWEALYTIGLKRRASAVWGAAGVGIFADVCMPARHMSIALLGVPKGWRAYATRGFDARRHEVETEYGVAADHCGAIPTLLVIGGGQRVAEVCRSLPGAVYVDTVLGSEQARNIGAKKTA